MILLVLPWPAVEQGKAFFPESGRFGRRQAPADSIATSASPSRLSPPRTLPSSREHNPSLNFGRRPPQPQTHYPPECLLRREARRRRLRSRRRPWRVPTDSSRPPEHTHVLRSPRDAPVCRQILAGAPPLFGRRGTTRAWPVKPDQWARRAHRQ